MFFDWINNPIVENYYIKDIQNWDAICASLHILKDLQRPKDEYFALGSINHLEAIGIMQVLFIEQDSVQTLKNAVSEKKFDGFKLNKYDAVRTTRNDSFGHPTDRGYKNSKTRHFFDIIDEKEQIVKHLFWGTEKEIESDKFVISDLVRENSETTLAYLSEIEEEIKNKFQNVMKVFKVKFDGFSQGVSHAFSKLLTKANDLSAIDLFNNVDQEIVRIKSGLLERNLFQDEYKRDIEVLEFLSGKLKPLLNSQTKDDIEFYTYVSTMNKNLRELSGKLRELDKSVITPFSSSAQTLFDS